jgi:hypothetical protein
MDDTTKMVGAWLFFVVFVTSIAGSVWNFAQSPPLAQIVAV